MIKYLELTAPESSEFRQAKILSIEVNEGDPVNVGDTLFRVQSGSSEIDLPSTKQGNITEVIAHVGENISLMTPLVLLETEVEESSASEPISNSDESKPDAAGSKRTRKQKAKQKKQNNKKINKGSKKNKNKSAAKKSSQQQSLDLSGDGSTQNQDAEQETERTQDTVEKSTQSVSTTNQQPAATTDSSDGDSPTQTPSNSMSDIQVSVPDIGGDSAKVIEILVNVGDQIKPEDPLVTLESDKASMDVPSPYEGVVSSIAIAVDEDVNEGTVLMTLSSSGAAQPEKIETAPESAEVTPEPAETAAAPAVAQQPAGAEIEVAIPDIGGDSAKVIEVLVSEGQQVDVEDPLVTLESDKASMDVPSSAAGIIKSIEVQLDQEVSEGVVVVKISSAEPKLESSKPDAGTTDTDSAPAPAITSASSPPDSAPPPPPAAVATTGKSHASPSVRRFARELGVGLTRVTATGRKGRISKDDVKKFVKGAMTAGISAPAAGSTSGIPAVPEVDFSKFGEIDVQPLNKIKRLTAKNLHRSWLNVPHVTHHDESNINDLESFRRQLNSENADNENFVKLSPLAFIVKAVVRGLQAYPQFNSSLDSSGENLIYKKYMNIGIAVETPNGLVVPVIRDADKMSVSKIAATMSELAAKARDKKLSPVDMSGACFTIS
ncbi:MAG: 2-oxo acid dehydrogenase subunit E2, partial [Arenicella sp.]|nr:2-oxo acid dehydrogenase subunit E2 [Arenicella sp.]